jgi:pyridoxal phosphate enzyme (YggS family)
VPKGNDAFEKLSTKCRAFGATLVAVSKTRSIPEIMQLYHEGQRIFGENRAAEILSKAPVMPQDMEWHLIGHLQSNKIRSVLPHVSCIQSLDSERLWEKINEEAKKINKQMDCLLQIKIAQEESKFGWDYQKLDALLKSGKTLDWGHVKITGVMGMATLTKDMAQVRKEMKQLKLYFDQLKENYFKENDEFKVISMGMSGDYKIALEEGSNMIRIGTMLFEK